MAYLALAVQAFGQWSSGQDRKDEARAAAASKEFEALQHEQNATTDIGAGQLRAADEQRKSRIVQSRALALAAASGGGASDPTVVNLISNLEAQGAYNAAVEMYQGEDRARHERMSANAARFEAASLRTAGSAYESAANTQAIGTIFEGAYRGSLYGKYGRPRQTSQDTGTPSGLGPYR